MPSQGRVDAQRRCSANSSPLTAGFLDQLNIDSANVAMSVSPNDLVTDVSATGTAQSGAGESTTLYTLRSNTTLRGTCGGRSFGAKNFDGVSTQATLDDPGRACRCLP